MENEKIRLGDIPEAIMDELKIAVSKRSVCLLALDERTGSQCGMGTYVEVGGISYILTAAHVIEQFLKNKHDISKIGFALGEGSVFARANLVDLVFACVGERKSLDWGPDLGFIRLPDWLAATLDTRLIRYNLSKRIGTEAVKPIGFDQGLWGFFGAPAALGDRREEEGLTYLDIRGNYYNSIIIDSCDKNGFDYCDVSIRGEKINFGGVSGGGLWQVPLKKVDGKLVLSIEKLSLEGVVYLQSSNLGGDRFVRCHGKQSIYRNLEMESLNWVV